MSKELKNIAKSYIHEYLKYNNPNLKINKTQLFECPFKHIHKDDIGKPTCKVYPQFGYKVTCYNSACGELGNIFDIFRRLEPDMKHLKDEEIADYLSHLLDIKQDEDVDKLLDVYYNSGFHLIPLCANDPSKTDKENAKLQKSPIQGESWKKNICHDLRKWKEWVDAGLGLGLVGGKISNVLLLDIDSDVTYEKMKDRINDTSAQDTKQGKHFLWEYDSDFDDINHCNFRKQGYEMEIRANNAYIVVAPTVVEGYIRTWNGKKITKMPKELKKFLLDLVKKESKKEEKKESDGIREAIENENFNIEDGLRGLDGNCNDTWITLGGILRKKMSPKKVEWALQTFNKLLADPMDYHQIKSMCYQLSKYDNFDKKDLAKEILEHLSLESVRFANAFEMEKSLGHTKKEIESALDYLLKEEKVVKVGRNFKALNKIEWETDFMSIGKPLGFEVPYFGKFNKFDDGSMIIIGGRSGTGKTHLAMNIIKKFVDMGINPKLLTTEAGSKFGMIGANLGLKIDDYFFKRVADATNVEFDDDSVTIIDWLKPPNSDYSKLDTIMENLNNQLVKHRGLLIALVQIRKDGTFFAPDLFDFYASLVATYNWTQKYNSQTKETVADSTNTYFQTSKMRDSKVGVQWIKIPTKFDKDTKIISLRTGE